MSRADKQAAWPRRLVHWCRACPCRRSVMVVNTPLDHRVLSIHFVPTPLPLFQGRRDHRKPPDHAMETRMQTVRAPSWAAASPVHVCVRGERGLDS